MRRTQALFSLFGSLAVLLAPGAGAEELPFPPAANRAEVRAQFELEANAETLLRQNGFVVLESNRRASLHEAYPGERKEGLPLLVTTDALLALWYELSRSIMSETEQRKLYPELARAVASLHRTGLRLRARAGAGPASQGLRAALVSLAVADRLFGSQVPPAPDLRGEVEHAWTRVMAAREVSYFPGEDYTQYRVRGHYTQNPVLSRYFRGSMWLSRRTLPVERQPDAQPDAALREAVALAAILREDPAARALLQSVARTRGFLAGTPNAVSVERVVHALEQVHGRRWLLAAAVSPSALDRLRRELGKTDYPEAKVWTRPTAPGTRFPRKVIALLPDGAVPDSRLFQATMHPSIESRTLPTPLEVGAGLGLDVARREIRSSDPRAADVLRQVDRIGTLGKPGEVTLYGGWLEALRSLGRTDPRAPRYMQGNAWQYKTLNTSLASWTHLRHTSLLYAAQPYGGGLGMSFAAPEALVEPIPAFYRTLATLARRTRVQLAGGLSTRSVASLRSLESKCGEFARCADAELANQLKPEQAHSIAEFGHWLETFQLRTEPAIVDVATGSTGDVLHVATGSFHPLLAMPDPQSGVVYCGWSMSYYEVRRPAFSRLTDAEWKSRLASQSLRPERPAWTGQFVARPGGAAFEAREPLRKAEALFLANRPDAALALLRTVVQQQRLAPLATEAQLRIGQYYFDRRDYRRTELELRQCERMYGCTATRVARRLLEQAQDQLRPSADDTHARRVAQQRRIHGLIVGLRSGKNPVASRGQEERLARVLLQEGHTIPPEAMAQMLGEAASLCRQEDLRWILKYAALNPRAELASFGMKTDETIEACLAFSRGNAPRPLRAGALALAVQAGLGGRDPARALQLLRPFRQPEVFRSEPTLSWLRSLPRRSFSLPLDPAELIDLEVRNILHRACFQIFQQGDWKRLEALQLDLLPADDQTSTELRQLFSLFADQKGVPLRLFITANGQESRRGLPAATAAFHALSQRYPTAQIAPYALWRALECAERAGDLKQAEQLRSELTQVFPNSYATLAARVGDAVEQWAPETVLPLDARTVAEGERLRELGLFLRIPAPSSLQLNLNQVVRSVQQVRPLLAPGQRPAVVRQLQAIHDQAALDLKVAELFPKQQPEVYLTLMDVGFSSLADSFLRRYPDHPGAKKAWEHVRSGSLEQNLSWLAPLVERGAAYPWEREAEKFLEWLVVRDGGSEEDEAAYLGWIQEHAAQVREARPGSRTVAVAELAVARALRNAYRPEAALALLQRFPADLRADDPLQAKRRDLTRTAKLEVAAKRFADWAPRWHTQIKFPAPQGAFNADALPVAEPLASGGLLLIPALVDQKFVGVVALDEETGTVRWSAQTGYPTSLAAEGDRRFYVATAQGTVVGLSAADGRVLFERRAEPNAERLTQVTAARDLVVAWGSGSVRAFSGANGEPRWQRPGNPLPGRLAVLNGTIFLASSKGKVTAIDLQRGNTIWERDFAKPEVDRTLTSELPTLGQGILAVRIGAEIQLLDPLNGRSRSSLLQDQSSSEYGAAVCDLEFTLVLPGQDAATYLRSVHGKVTARDRHHGTAEREVIYWFDQEGRAMASDAETGACLQWSTEVPRSYRGIVVGRHVYFVSDSGQIVALPQVEIPQVEP